MKTLCLALGVARSHVHQRFTRKTDWRDGRKAKTRTPESDGLLIDAVRAEITSLPTYGYRRARALVNRRRSLIGLHPVNHKRIYRLLKQHALLLPKAPKRRASNRPHEGKVRRAGVEHALVLDWCRDRLRQWTSRHRDLYQGLLRPRDHCLASVARARPAGRAGAGHAE